MHGRRACGHHFQLLPTNPGGSHVRECERDLPTDRRAMERFTNAFISRLPKYMQEAISPSLAA
uniref:hypothetical protein n=1 Tax=Lactobacillus helveticus TaxID=1587 RepID=UPI00191BA030|nr:hypothetical protein [Lactobacillus helveticus]